MDNKARLASASGEGPDIDRLPDEVLVKIFERVGTRPMPRLWSSRMPVTSALLCALVCRRWRALADVAVTELALANIFVSPRFSTLRFTNLRRLRFKNVFFTLADPGVTVIREMARLTPQLQVLEFEDCRNQDQRAFLARKLVVGLPQWKSLRKLALADMLQGVSCDIVLALLNQVRLTPMLEDFSFELDTEEDEEVQEIVGKMVHLRTLGVNFPDGLFDCLFDQLGSLTHLSLEDFSQMGLPETLTKLESLKTLRIARSYVGDFLPDPIANLGALRVLRLESMRSLCSLTEAITQLQCLEELHLVDCVDVAGIAMVEEEHQWGATFPLPYDVGNLRKLQVLRVLDCPGMWWLPPSLGSLERLRELEIDGCSEISQLPDGIGALSGLRVLGLGGCCSLASVPRGISSLAALEELRLSGAISSDELLESVCRLRNLRHLALVQCRSLDVLPEEIGHFEKLRELRVEECLKLRALPESLGRLSGLRSLKVRQCPSLQGLPRSLGGLRGLWEMEVWDCRALREVTMPPQLSNFKSVRPNDAYFHDKT